MELVREDGQTDIIDMLVLAEARETVAKHKSQYPSCPRGYYFHSFVGSLLEVLNLFPAVVVLVFLPFPWLGFLCGAIKVSCG